MVFIVILEDMPLAGEITMTNYKFFTLLSEALVFIERLRSGGKDPSLVGDCGCWRVIW